MKRPTIVILQGVSFLLYTFELRSRNARKGRDPRTGEEIDIPASNIPAFRAGKSFKESVNQ